ncbi:MAG: T9SS type A sorting domain-containing protein [bacterium]|nr:T9SS type A sorting domain-containing protein [bacterium]
MRTTMVLIGLLVIASLAFGYPSNVPAGYAGNPPSNNTCHNCHATYALNSGGGSVVLTGLPAGGYVSSTVYHLTLTATKTGSTRWGFQATPIYQSGASWLQAGTLTLTDPTHTSLVTGSGTAPDYVEQTSSGTYPSTPGPTSWIFDWTAPATTTGTVSFYFVGMGANNNGGTSGDYVYSSSAMVSPASSGPTWDVSIAAVSPPIVIPANGGSFQYTINVYNLGTAPATFFLWNKVKDGAGNWTNVLGPLSRTLPGGANPTRTMTQNIAATVSPGTCYYVSYIGPNSTTIVDSSFFTFTKSAVADGGLFVNDFKSYGDLFENVTVSTATPQDFVVMNNYPNPFNPATTLSFVLPEAAKVNLTVYDVSGHQVANLVNGWREAGRHDVTFDGSNLASGVYLYRLTSGAMNASGKMMLLK